jgi:hypothetical protein
MADTIDVSSIDSVLLLVIFAGTLHVFLFGYIFGYICYKSPKCQRMCSKKRTNSRPTTPRAQLSAPMNGQLPARVVSSDAERTVSLIPGSSREQLVQPQQPETTSTNRPRQNLSVVSAIRRLFREQPTTDDHTGESGMEPALLGNVIQALPSYDEAIQETVSPPIYPFHELDEGQPSHDLPPSYDDARPLSTDELSDGDQRPARSRTSPTGSTRSSPPDYTETDESTT